MPRHEHALILASAGTGKTFRLTNRVIALLARAEDPGSILATTFTRKAAGEILSRVLAGLARATIDEKALAELREHADDTLTRARCLDLIRTLTANLPRLSVQTIDSFFMRLATGFALDLGAPPGWRVLSEEEASPMRREAIRRALDRHDADEAVLLFTLMQKGGARRSVVDGLETTIDQAHTLYLETRDNVDAWRRVGPDGEPLTSDEVALALERLRDADLPTNKNGKTNGHWRKGHDAVLNAAECAEWERFVALGLVAKCATPGGTFHSIELPETYRQSLLPLRNHACRVLLARLAQANAATLALMHRYDEALTELKRESGLFAFEDVPRMLIDGGVTGALPTVYYRLDRTLRHVLLDEFQDTSVTQFRLLEPILDELLSQDEPARSVFCVGDVKQSLYAWRSAEPDLMPMLGKRWPPLGERRQALNVNYRSSQTVLDAVNLVFASLTRNAALTPDHDAVARAWDDGYQPHVAHHADMPGHVELAAFPDEDEPEDHDEEDGNDEQPRATSRFNAVAERIRAMLDAAPRATVGVLTRTRRDIPACIAALRAVGILASEETGNPVTDAPAVAAAVSLLRLVDHPGDTLRLFHVATSPLGPAAGITDPRDTRAAARPVRALRRKLMSDGYAPTLAALADRIAPSLDRRGAERFEQLIELAGEFDARPAPDGACRTRAFVRMAEERRVTEPGSRRVRVMTIHASKGLEFDCVILPELTSPWRLRPGAMLYDRPDPLSNIEGVSIYTNQTVRDISPTLQALHDRTQARDVREQLCVLYVAMTRARRVLEMLIPAEKPRGGLCARHLLIAALGLDPNADAEPGAVLWSSPGTSRAHALAPVESEAPSPEAPPPAIELRLPRTTAPHRAQPRSPSSLEGGGTVQLEDLIRPDDDAPRRLGSLIHAWFEAVAWLDGGAPDDSTLLAAAADAGVDNIPARLAEFREALTRADTPRILSRDFYASRNAPQLRLWRERPFAVELPGDGDEPGALMTGYFDRVVIGKNEHGRALWADIVDFKTDRVEPGAPTDARAEHYRPQLEAYRRSAAAMLGLDPSRVTARLLFTTQGRSIEI